MMRESGSMQKEDVSGYGPSAYDIAHIEDILYGEGDWFSAKLLRLIAKADEDNLERLRKGFPRHVEVLELWRRGELL